MRTEYVLPRTENLRQPDQPKRRAAPPRSGASRRFAWIAGPGMFRMILALLVFASHVSSFEVGRPAVMIFFILSGYWVVRLYDVTGSDPIRFEADRLLRVWPLFAVVSLLAWAANRLAGVAPQGSLASTLPLIGLASRTGDFVGVSWSLDIEAQFYLLLPLALFLLARAGPAFDLPRRLAVLVVVTAVGAVLLRYGTMTLAAFAPAFAAGAAIWRYRWSPRFAVAMASLAAFAVCLVIMATVPALQTLLSKAESQWWRDLVHLGWCLLLVPFIAWNVHQPSGALDRQLGNLSYPFYLLHPLIIVVAVVLLGPLHLAGKLAALAATLAATMLLYLLIDRPIDRLRKQRLRGAVRVA